MPDCAKKQCRKISLDNYDGPEQINGFERSCCWKSPCVDSYDLLVCKNCSMASEILPILALQNPSSHIESGSRNEEWGILAAWHVSLNEGRICPSWVRKQRGYGLL
jgi:hypothetical protein